MTDLSRTQIYISATTYYPRNDGIRFTVWRADIKPNTTEYPIAWNIDYFELMENLRKRGYRIFNVDTSGDTLFVEAMAKHGCN